MIPYNPQQLTELLPALYGCYQLSLYIYKVQIITKLLITKWFSGGRQAGRQAGRRAGGQAGRRAGRQAGRQAGM